MLEAFSRPGMQRDDTERTEEMANPASKYTDEYRRETADYNRGRPHSAIGYQIPAMAMDAFFERTRPRTEGLPMAA